VAGSNPAYGEGTLLSKGDVNVLVDFFKYFFYFTHSGEMYWPGGDRYIGDWESDKRLQFDCLVIIE